MNTDGITVEAEPLEEGWDIRVTGGDRSHVGAVTLAEPDGAEQTIERPGHKDAHVSRPWAVRLAKAWQTPVCVRCGIHYDHASREQIEDILAACDGLLERLEADAAQIRQRWEGSCRLKKKEE